MKIIHVAETVHGGIATYLNEIVPIQSLKYGKENVYVLAPREQLDCLGEGFNNFSFESKGRSFFSIFNLIVVYIKVMSSFKPDVVHIHSSFAGFFCRTVHLFLFKKVAVVYCSHGWSFSMSTGPFKKNIYALVERCLSVLTDRIVCISKFEKKLAVSYGFSEKKCVVVYNGISRTPPDFVEGGVLDSNDKVKFLFVGRFHHAKGFDLLIPIFERLKGKADLYVAGGARLDNELDFSVPDNVHKLGWLSSEELQFYYQICDAVIVPSRWEGFGFVAVEAMRQKKAVFGSSSGGIPETIISGKTGIIFNIDETPESISEKILLYTKADLRDMGENGYVHFLNNFLVDSTVSGLDKVYLESLKCRKR
ncbi:glycosyltransferase [Neptunomonas concharum]|uniref:Glycosyltransferase family 4 protein n=1 Tax=Neptunomonas concharum TaxID=1031538 RepID=A0A5P1R8S1_9GAMM|nr:glycosyltransferase [Neptunomonas concharum]QEQ95987.1 glycosyltransferase family 4 protein [Neptunomonas concharum]